jgi:phosphatidylinositol alpha-1,6-mannosyltransferase
MPCIRPPVILTHEFYPFRGGVARYVQELSLKAHQMGIAIELCCQQPASRVGAWPFITLSIPGTGSLGWQDTFRFVHFIKQNQEPLTKRIICIASWGALRAWALANFRPQDSDIRLLFHGSEILKIHQHLWLWKPFFKRLFRQDNVSCFATTPFVQKLLLNSSCFPQNRPVALAPCGLGGFFENLPPPTILPIEPDKGILILTVARIDPRKGQLDAIKALGILPESIRSRLCYHLIGRGSPQYLKTILRHARSRGVRCIHTSDANDERLRQEYSRAYLLIQPSRTLKHSVEGFGLSVIEAASRGCPCVAYDSGGLSSAIIQGTTGWLVPEGNIEALSRAVLEAIKNPEERNRRAIAAREFSMTHNYATAVNALLH